MDGCDPKPRRGARAKTLRVLNTDFFDVSFDCARTQ
jgi:hypothetical protein